MTVSTSNLKRETSSGGNQKTYTVSAWCKNTCKVGNSQTIFSSDVEDDGSNYGSLSIESDGIVKFINLTSGSLVTNYQSNRQLQDATSFYHIVLRVDTTQSTASDRIRIYINGEQLTSWAYSTTPSQNTDTGVFKSGSATLIGARHSSSSQNRWEGYLGHVHIVDGSSLAPTVFGETDSTSGIWKPKLSPTGITYGTNGAFLKFLDASALGTDSSGNTNTYTVIGNLKQGTDTPSNNFCTLDTHQVYGANVNGGNKIDFAGTSTLGTSGISQHANGTQMVKNGKWYWEVKLGGDNTSADRVSIDIYKNGTFASKNWRAGTLYGKETGSNGCEAISYQPQTSTPNLVDDGGGGTVNYGVQASQNDIIMCALDLSGTTAKWWLGKNGTWFNAPSTSSAGDPANSNHAGISFVKGDDFWGFAVGSAVNNAGNANTYMHCNFGQGRFGADAVASANADGNSVGAFEYAVPSGFYAICTKNIKTYG